MTVVMQPVMVMLLFEMKSVTSWLLLSRGQMEVEQTHGEVLKDSEKGHWQCDESSVRLS